MPAQAAGSADDSVPLDAAPAKAATGRRRRADIGQVQYSQAFEEWWTEYPAIRRTDKVKCYEFWKREQLGDFAETLMLDLKKRKAEDWGWLKDGGQYVPQPYTYLYNSRWNDPIVPAPMHGSRRSQIEDDNSRVLDGWANGETP